MKGGKVFKPLSIEWIMRAIRNDYGSDMWRSMTEEHQLQVIHEFTGLALSAILFVRKVRTKEH